MKRTIRELTDLHGQRALVRVDFNVPLDENKRITDDSRIRESLPTIRYLLERGARVILVSHLGRPKGQVNPEYSLKPVVDRLQELLPTVSVEKASAVFNTEVQVAAERMQPGSVLVLENVRFEPGEEKNDSELANKLASLADIYVNDAFGAAHRAHASTEGIAHFVKTSVAGLLMEKEINALSGLLQNPEKPFTAIIGGSKVSTKITVLETLLEKVNTLVIGGAMIFTFLKAQGFSVGQSKVEDDYLETANTLLTKAQEKGVSVLLPSDVVVADAFSNEANKEVIPVDKISEGWMGLDVGPDSIQKIAQVLAQSRTVLWNGPMGVFEFPNFAAGTEAVARTLAHLTKEETLKSVLGGGDTVAAIAQFGMSHEDFTHVSTGGGASLEFIEGKTLPGIAVLQDAETVRV